jgi:hypothetical protein
MQSTISEQLHTPNNSIRNNKTGIYYTMNVLFIKMQKGKKKLRLFS